MTKSLLILILATFTSQMTLASCDNSNIPGHYVGRYVDNNDGTITDKMTNLMWMKCDVDIPWDEVNKACFYDDQVLGGGQGRISYTWQEALNSVTNINLNAFANRTDWRLPNIKELSSILEINCLSNDPREFSNNYAIDTTVFSIFSAIYWSSTPRVESYTPIDGTPITNQAWNTTFRRNSSKVGSTYKSITDSFSARLVRFNR